MSRYLIIILTIVFSMICFGQSGNQEFIGTDNYKWSIIAQVPSGMNQIFFIDSTKGWIVGDSGKVYSTGDGGVTWNEQYSGTKNSLRSLIFIDESLGFISGYNRTLLQSTNQGNSWSAIPLVSDSGSIYHSLGTDEDNNIYFITNYGEVYFSNDLGVNWDNIYNFDSWGFSFCDYSNNPTCYTQQTVRGNYYKSTDGGESWRDLSAPAQYTNHPFFLNADVGWIAESWYPSSIWHDSVFTYMTLDGGESWIQKSSLQGKALDDLIFINELEGWASMVNKIFHTTNGSDHWTCQFESDEIGFIKDIFFLDRENGWTLTNNGEIIKYVEDVETKLENSTNSFKNYSLYQNFPNPFNPSTTISYTIESINYISLKVYDLLGNEIRTLVEEEQGIGSYNVIFVADDLPSGIYLYQLKIGNRKNITKTMLLLK